MAPLLSFQVANSGTNIHQHAYQEVSTVTGTLALSLIFSFCVAYNKSTRYRRQNSPVSEREFLKIGKGHVEAK